MGGALSSTPTLNSSPSDDSPRNSPNPPDSNSPSPAMSSPDSSTVPQSLDPKTSGNPSDSSIDNTKPLESDLDQSNASIDQGGEGEGDEEEGECGFCLFMKAGGCKESFIAWEKCIEDAEKKKEDIVEKCFQATSALKQCMEAHADYYEPILRAEKAAEEEAVKELEKEKASKESEQSAASKGSEQNVDSKDLEQK